MKTDNSGYVSADGITDNQYTLLQDYVANTPATNPTMSGFSATFKKGQLVNGISYDNGKTISTTKDGSLPTGAIGITLFAIPVSNIQKFIIPDGDGMTSKTSSSNTGIGGTKLNDAATEITKVATTNNLQIAIYVVAAIGTLYIFKSLSK